MNCINIETDYKRRRSDFLYAGAFLGWPAEGGQYLNLFRLIAFTFWLIEIVTSKLEIRIILSWIIHYFTCLIYLICKKKQKKQLRGPQAAAQYTYALSGGIFQSLAAGKNCIRKHCFIFNLCFLGGTLRGPVCGPARQVESNLDNYSQILWLFWIV